MKYELPHFDRVHPAKRKEEIQSMIYEHRR